MGRYGRHAHPRNHPRNSNIKESRSIRQVQIYTTNLLPAQYLNLTKQIGNTTSFTQALTNVLTRNITSSELPPDKKLSNDGKPNGAHLPASSQPTSALTVGERPGGGGVHAVQNMLCILNADSKQKKLHKYRGLIRESKKNVAIYWNEAV